MLEYASFGFVMLVWWTWPALWALVLSAVYASYRLSVWRDRRYDRKHGHDVRPCMTHLGTSPDGLEHWCWQQKGHKGAHLTQWGVPQEDFDPEAQEAWEREFPPDSELAAAYDEDELRTRTGLHFKE